MLNNLKLYFSTLIVSFMIDMVWLVLVAQAFYKQYLGFLMAPETNWTAAMIFYLLFIVGILYFVVLPGLKDDSLRKTMFSGALFGLISYATYDLTNLATVKDWPLIVTIVDLAWGTFFSLLISAASFMIGKKMHWA